jgi:hypothetical protein
MDEPALTGWLVPGKLIEVIEVAANQQQKQSSDKQA